MKIRDENVKREKKLKEKKRQKIILFLVVKQVKKSCTIIIGKLGKLSNKILFFVYFLVHHSKESNKIIKI